MKYTEKEVRHYLSMCYFKLDENGLSPQQCYYLYDTYGKKILPYYTCTDPITVQRIIWGKSLMNMNVKMWSEDIKDGLLKYDELKLELEMQPSWVKKSLENSLK